MATERSTAPHSSSALLAPSSAPLRTGIVTNVGLDLLLVYVSFVGAHLLRFGGEAPTLTQAAAVLPAIGLLKVGVFYQFRLYRTVWTHAGTPDILRLVYASSVSSAGLLLGLVVFQGMASLPVAFLVLDWMFTTITTGANRFSRRVFNEPRTNAEADRRRVLIYGADAHGVILLRYLQRAAPTASVVGFVDPDHDGLQLRNHPVVETQAAVDADALIVPVPTSSPEDDSDHDRTQVIDSHAPLDISCQQFKLTMDAAAPSRE